MIKKTILWLLKSYFYLVPIALIVAGAYLFARFTPNYFGMLTFLWVIIVSFFYIKYSRWY
jgi:hypothetical protein